MQVNKDKVNLKWDTLNPTSYLTKQEIWLGDTVHECPMPYTHKGLGVGV